MPALNRKPVGREGEVEIPALMRSMGVKQWLNLPISIVDQMMMYHPSEEFRIFFCVLRFSYGYQMTHAVRVVIHNDPDGRPTVEIKGPMRIADIAKQVSVSRENTRSKLLKMEKDGWIEKDSDDSYSVVYKSFKNNELSSKRSPNRLLFWFSDPNISLDRKREYFRQLEAIEAKEQAAIERALHQVEEEYQPLKQTVNNKFGVEKVERKPADKIPDDPRVAVRE